MQTRHSRHQAIQKDKEPRAARRFIIKKWRGHSELYFGEDIKRITMMNKQTDRRRRIESLLQLQQIYSSNNNGGGISEHIYLTV